jgi:hypothetical protein
LTVALNSARAYAVEFDPGSSSKVPDAVVAMTKKGASKAAFIKGSQELATYLFGEHTGNVSPGLMCVVDVRAGGRRGLALLKLERENGAQLQPTTDKEGKKSFELLLLDSLVFTDGTRLFKAALFMRTKEEPPEFEARACDSQLTAASPTSMAKFWLRFLGAKYVTEPRVATKAFFEVALKAISDLIDDPVEKARTFEALHAELTSNAKWFSPRAFSETHMHDSYRRGFQERLKAHNIGLGQFEKDVGDIFSKLRRRQYETTNGVSITVSEERANLVEVKERQVIVNDELLKVK